MERARKMVLVPKEQFDRLRSVSQSPLLTQEPPAVPGSVALEPQPRERSSTLQSTQTPGDNLTRLDDYMKQILESKTYGDEHEKLKDYLQSLRRYLFFIEEKRKPVASETEDGYKPYENSKFDEAILSSVPKLYQKKTKLLLDHLKIHKDRITWDSKGAVYIDGEKIKDSNIVDLMNYAARPRKNSKATGRREFAKLLRETSTPHEYVGNHEIWQFNSTPTSYKEKTVDSDNEELDFFDVNDKTSLLENTKDLTPRQGGKKKASKQRDLPTSTPLSKKKKSVGFWLKI